MKMYEATSNLKSIVGGFYGCERDYHDVFDDDVRDHIQFPI